VAEQSRDAVQRSQRLLDLWQDYRERVQKARAPALLLKLVDALFERVAITIPQAGGLLGVTPRSAQLNLEKLERIGILGRFPAVSTRRHRLGLPGGRARRT
jgi:Fic family protein